MVYTAIECRLKDDDFDKKRSIYCDLIIIIIILVYKYMNKKKDKNYNQIGNIRCLQKKYQKIKLYR